MSSEQPTARVSYVCLHYYIIPEQFNAKAHPALFEGQGRGGGGGGGGGRGGGGGEGQTKLRNTFQRLRPEEFSSGDLGLRSFRRPEISAWAEISEISNLRNLDLVHF